GKAYEPLFPGAVDLKAAANARQTARVGAGLFSDPDMGKPKAWVVVPANFVTTEDGTGVVHTAVMYGEDDYWLGVEQGLPAQHTVGLDGNFFAHVPGGVAGRYVKAPETEAAILAFLKAGDLLYREERYEHSYPHCWRTGHPLLYYAMDSWYIRMGSLRDQLLANNDQVNWVPETIKE